MDTTIAPLVFTLWRVALAVAYQILVPIAIYWLHSLWRASRSIMHYAEEGAGAAETIARNTAAIPALDSTIAVATEVLTAAEAVAGKLDAAASALEARAGS